VGGSAVGVGDGTVCVGNILVGTAVGEAGAVGEAAPTVAQAVRARSNKLNNNG
jgi:hypothetical protein